MTMRRLTSLRARRLVGNILVLIPIAFVALLFAGLILWGVYELTGHYGWPVVLMVALIVMFIAGIVIYPDENNDV